MSEIPRGPATHGLRARLGLEPLLRLVGEWEGQGMDAGGAVRARSTGSLLLDGTYLQLHDRLLDEGGSVYYADVTLYRFDPVEENLRVIHLAGQGHRHEYPVLRSAEGLRWVTGPEGPRVSLHFHEEGWSSRVVLPGEVEPALEVTYRPVSDPRAR